MNANANKKRSRSGQPIEEPLDQLSSVVAIPEKSVKVPKYMVEKQFAGFDSATLTAAGLSQPMNTAASSASSISTTETPASVEVAIPASSFGGSSLEKLETPNRFGMPAKIPIPKQEIPNILHNTRSCTKNPLRAKSAVKYNIYDYSDRRKQMRNEPRSKSKPAKSDNVSKAQLKDRLKLRLDFAAVSSGAGSSPPENTEKSKVVVVPKPVAASTVTCLSTIETTTTPVLAAPAPTQVGSTYSSSAPVTSLSDAQSTNNHSIKIMVEKKAVYTQPKLDEPIIAEATTPAFSSGGSSSLAKSETPFFIVPNYFGNVAEKKSVPFKGFSTSSGTVSPKPYNGFFKDPNAATTSSNIWNFYLPANGATCSNQSPTIPQQGAHVSGPPLNSVLPGTLTRPPTGEQIIAELDKQNTLWSCSACTFENDSLRQICGLCCANRPVCRSNENQNSQWSCPVCTLHNDVVLKKCECCDTERNAVTANDENVLIVPSSADVKVNPYVKESQLFGECVICSGADSEFVFIDCGHLCVCKVCVVMFLPVSSQSLNSQNWRHKCPKCRKKIEHAPILVYQDKP